MNFSIVIVTYNRKKALERCLQSIRQSPTNLPYEVIVIFNGEKSYLASTSKTFPECSSYYISACSPAEARNFGITKCQGKSILFLDDDCFIPENYFENVDFSFDWDVLGGPDRTPADATLFQQHLGQALSSPLCMGMTYKRHSSASHEVNASGTEASLILCNLWFKADLFHKENYRFQTDLFRNEENFLLKELKNNSKKIFYNSNLQVFHTRRKDLISVGHSIISSGECRVKNFVKLPATRELIYLLPLVFTVSLIVMIFNPLSYMSVLFGLYTLAIIINSLIRKNTNIPLVTFLHYYILIFYSVGLLKGIRNYIVESISKSLFRLIEKSKEQ